jgi:protein subunit release factor B
MPVSIEKKAALSSRMEELGIKEDDLIEKFILGSGKGGQKVNKTASCVYLKHLPTGFEVKCQKERSRELNRYLARRDLCDKISCLLKDEKTKKQREQERIRRQKKRRSRKLKQKILEEKKRRSEIKSLRGKVEE